MAVSDAMGASRRRLVFGVNVIVQGVLAVVLVVAVVWLAGRFKLQSDLTRTGVNSLSPRTQQLLGGLDQNIRVTAVFAEPDKRDQLGQKRRRQIRDLLDLYDAAGGAHVSTYLVDPSLEKAQTDKLLQRLTELPAYKDQAQPHREALEKYPGLNDKILKLVQGDVAHAQVLVEATPRAAQDRNFGIVRNNLRIVERDAGSVPETIEELKKSEIPRYGQAIEKMRDALGTAQLALQDAYTWMSTEGLSIAGLTPELRTFFQEAPSRYEAVLAEIAALLDATKDLEDVKLEELYTGLTRWRTSPPVLVENEDEARVLSFWEVWPPPTNPNAPVGPDGDNREFAGEAAISSAVLQLTRKEKTAVIFTRFGGESPIRPDFSRIDPMMRQLPRAPYQQLNALLEKANFLTEDWDVAQAKTPPEVKDAVRRVFIVFPPEPPPRPNPMQPMPPPAAMTLEDRQIILDAIGKSGMAVFLAGWMPSSSPMPGASGTYEFAEYLKTTWGVDGQYDYLTLAFTPNPEKPGLWVPASQDPKLISTDRAVRFTDHQIGQPLQAERGSFYTACPLRIVPDGDRPEGVSVEVVAEVRETDDVWACGDLMRLDQEWRQNQGFRRDESDAVAPFPIVLAATNAQGQKVVVFGSEQFAADMLAQATGLQRHGDSLVLGPLYPANSDLLINSLHWLTGEADRIAVGPRSGNLPRLTDLNDKWAARVPWLLVGVWPAVALLVGIGMWLVRRR